MEGVLHKPLAVGDYTNHDLTRTLPSPCDLNFGSPQKRERQATKSVLYRSSGTAPNPASGESVLDMDDGFLDEEHFECVLRPPPALLSARRKVSDQYVGAKLGESAPAQGSIDVLTKHMMWSTWRSSVQKAAQRLELIHCLFAVEIRSLEGRWFNPFAPSQEHVAVATAFAERLRASSRAQHDADWNKLFELLQISIAMTRKEHADILNAVCVSNRTEPWCQVAILVERLYLEYASATGESAGMAYDAIVALSRTSPSRGVPFGAHLERLSQAVNVYLAVHAEIPSAPPINMMTLYANVLRVLSSASAPEVWRSHAGILLQAWDGGRNERGPTDIMWLEAKLRSLTAFDLAVTGGGVQGPARVQSPAQAKRLAAAGNRRGDRKAKTRSPPPKARACFACGGGHPLSSCKSAKKVRALLDSALKDSIPDAALEKDQTPMRIIELCNLALEKIEDSPAKKDYSAQKKRVRIDATAEKKKSEETEDDSDEERGSRRRGCRK